MGKVGRYVLSIPELNGAEIVTFPVELRESVKASKLQVFSKKNGRFGKVTLIWCVKTIEFFEDCKFGKYAKEETLWQILPKCSWNSFDKFGQIIRYSYLFVKDRHALK